MPGMGQGQKRPGEVTHMDRCACYKVWRVDCSRAGLKSQQPDGTRWLGLGTVLTRSLHWKVGSWESSGRAAGRRGRLRSRLSPREMLQARCADGGGSDWIVGS